MESFIFLELTGLHNFVRRVWRAVWRSLNFVLTAIKTWNHKATIHNGRHIVTPRIFSTLSRVKFLQLWLSYCFSHVTSWLLLWLFILYPASILLYPRTPMRQKKLVSRLPAVIKGSLHPIPIPSQSSFLFQKQILLGMWVSRGRIHPKSVKDEVMWDQQS